MMMTWCYDDRPLCSARLWGWLMLWALILHTATTIITTNVVITIIVTICHHRNTTITIIIKIGSDHHDEEGSHQVVVAKVGADLKSCNERKFSIFRRLRLQCISIRIMIIMIITTVTVWWAYILKVDKLAESVFFASQNWRKKCVNCDKKNAKKVLKLHKYGVFNNKLSK